jgi:hypothetical protein
VLLYLARIISRLRLLPDLLQRLADLLPSVESVKPTQHVPEEMRTGAGRWRLLAQRPGSMALYYVQTTLKQKLEVSNFGTRWTFDDNIDCS